MYWNAIIWFMTWPILILTVWFLVRYIVSKYKDSFEKIEE